MFRKPNKTESIIVIDIHTFISDLYLDILNIIHVHLLSF